MMFSSDIDNLIRRAAIGMFSTAIIFLTALPVLAEEAPELTFDGLVPVEGAAVGMAYIDPDADFSVYSRVAILDLHVAFRSNWQRNQNRQRGRRVSNSDMERIKADVANLFRDVFIETLEADDGFEVVTGAAEDVLLLRPAIIDLDITAPDRNTAGRSRTYTASTGSATLYIELFDSMTSAIIGRAADNQRARRAGGTLSWSNRVTNQADARRMFRGWAQQLREFLHQHYRSKAEQE